jgi:hypothetical protein
MYGGSGGKVSRLRNLRVVCGDCSQADSLLDVLPQFREDIPRRRKVPIGNSGAQTSVEPDRSLRQSLEEDFAFLGQFQDMDPAIGGVALPCHQPLRFHAVEVVRQCRALDPGRLGNLALIRSGVRFERNEHHPGCLASTLRREDCVELLSHQLGRSSQLSPDRFLRWSLHYARLPELFDIESFDF